MLQPSCLRSLGQGPPLQGAGLFFGGSESRYTPAAGLRLSAEELLTSVREVQGAAYLGELNCFKRCSALALMESLKA